MHEEIGEGLRFLFGHRLLRVLAVMVGVSNLASSAAFSVFVLYAVSPGPIGLDEVGFGLLMTGLAIGNVLGTLIVEPLERRLGRANLLAFSMSGFILTVLIPGLTTSAPIIAVVWILGGFIGIGWNVVTVSLRQRIVPDRLLGRVNASYRLLAWGTMPIGAALGGLAGEALRPPRGVLDLRRASGRSSSSAGWWSPIGPSRRPSARRSSWTHAAMMLPGSAARDGEGAFHALLLVAGELADEGVVADFQGHGQVLGQAGYEALDLVDHGLALEDLELVLDRAGVLDGKSPRRLEP